MRTSPDSLLRSSSTRQGPYLARWAAAVFALAIIAILPGCYPAATADAAVVVECDTAPDPPQRGPTLVSCLISDPEGERLQAADVMLEANMTHPGMQPIHASMSESASGRYESRIDLTMAGDWYLVITGEVSGMGRFEETVNLPGVRTE